MSNLLSLDDLGKQFGTDKSSLSHDYLGFYEMFLASKRNDPVKVLEVGVLGGASLKMWAAYFPEGRIVGADLDPTTRRFAGERIAIEIVNQSNVEDLAFLAAKHGPFDLVVEDGSHIWDHQITTLRSIFPFVKSGGVYIVEDLQTNFGSYSHNYRGVATESCMEYLKRLVDLKVADRELNINAVDDAFLRTYGRFISFISFYRHACLIKKGVAARGDADVGVPLIDAVVGQAGRKVRLLGHFGKLGDLPGPDGYLNPGENFPLQGLTCETSGGLLEVAVKSRNGAWSEWLGERVFAGSRGQSLPLVGVKVRLKAGEANRRHVNYAVRFVGSQNILEAADGEECVSAAAQPICGIEVRLSEAS